jgi:translation initiation factor IF-2
MKKIRINELARELEVKPGAILDLLPELGVAEKKTHSSSVDEDVAELLRKRLTGAGGEEHRRAARDEQESAGEIAATDEKTKEDGHILTAPTHAEETTLKPPAEPLAQEVPVPPLPEMATVHPAPRPLPIRPPLAAPAGLRHAGPAVPSIPIPPHPVTHVAPHAPAVAAVPTMQSAAQPVPMAPARPVTAPPPAPAPPAARVQTPALPPSRPAVPGTPRPAAPAVPQKPRERVARVVVEAEKPPMPGEAVPRPSISAQTAPPQAVAASPAAPAVPAMPRTPAAPMSRNVPLGVRAGAPAGPRPGTILSGPRQPLPGGEIPRSPMLPGVPRPHLGPPSRPAPQSSMPPSGQTGHSGQPLRPTLAGQPAARPIVPPRPDLVARLSQIQTKPSPGQPPSPRPGMPTPGRPLYQGPRPGQPGPRPAGPGAPMGPGRPGMRGRGLHPTTPVLEPPTPATEAGRRDAAKKRPLQREREVDREGKIRTFGPRKQEAIPLPVVDREITISEGITVKEFADKLGVKASLVIKTMFERKIFATINQTLDVKMATEIALQFGAKTSRMSYEEESVQAIEGTEVEGDRATRPPVVTVMGHVDHGKTSLLDAIRETNVAAREAGGITQHVGAYHVEINGRKIVFIDTPGHEAFTRMRSRGASVTDIVVLVIAADDGVMPQTREAIDHARAAKVPIIVALNKIDKPDAQPERVKQQLTDLALMPEEWGGDTPFVPVSAKKRQNIELLLEMILLVADMQELKGNPGRPAVATVLEAELDRGRGPVATCIVRNGTLKIGDFYICGSVFGKVRALYDDRGGQIKEAGPSMPIELLGLESMPEVGDTLQVVTDLAKARQIAEFREVKAREVAMAKTRITLEMVHAQLREGEKKELNIILKADVGGTAEVLSDTLQKLSNDKVSIRVLHAGVGAITETDVTLASASEAIIIGFNVRPDRKAAELAEHEGVDIRLHTIIYELTDELKRAMSGMLDPVFKEVYLGRADVRNTFRISKVGTVAGLYVQDGMLQRDCEVRLLRDNVVVFTGRLLSLKRFKNDASEVKAGFECGASIANFNDLKQGDVIEAFAKEKVAQEIFT